MISDTAFQRLRDANPVPNPELLTDGIDLDGLLVDTTRRSAEMQTREKTPTEKGSRSQRKGLVAAALMVLAALVIVIGFGLVEGEVADPEPSEVVEMALDAWSRGDADMYFGLLADDARWFGLRIGDPGGEVALDRTWDLNTARDATFVDVSCVATEDLDPVTDGVIVDCTGRFEDMTYGPFGAEPLPFEARYAVGGGQIVNAMSYTQEQPEWMPFLFEFLEDIGPEFADLCDGPDYSGPECADFMREHVDEAATAWSEQS